MICIPLQGNAVTWWLSRGHGFFPTRGVMSIGHGIPGAHGVGVSLPSLWEFSLFAPQLGHMDILVIHTQPTAGFDPC